MSSENLQEIAAKDERRGRPHGDLYPKTPFAKRLQFVVGQGTIQHLADTFDVHRDTWRNFYVGDREPTIGLVQRIVEITGCNGHWLLTGRGDAYPTNAASQASRGAPILVPFGGRIHRNREGGRIVFDPEGDPLYIPPHVAHMRLSGDSLLFRIGQGHSLLVDTSTRPPRDGDLVLLDCLDERTFFKRYYEVDGNAEISLAGVDPTSPEPPVRIKADNIRRLSRIVGVWSE